MKRRARDFTSLFNVFWYRDFPVTPDRLEISRPALWTTHIASTVKLTADHLGLYTRYETGGKTDAVIEDSAGDRWAKVEWEWAQPHKESVNEIEKLASASSEAEVFIFIGYSRGDHHHENLNCISQQWAASTGNKPLLAFLVAFSWSKGRRQFETLQTHLFRGQAHQCIRQQPALPWQVKGTKWQALARGHADA